MVLPIKRTAFWRALVVAYTRMQVRSPRGMHSKFDCFLGSCDPYVITHSRSKPHTKPHMDTGIPREKLRIRGT